MVEIWDIGKILYNILGGKSCDDPYTYNPPIYATKNTIYECGIPH